MGVGEVLVNGSWLSGGAGVFSVENPADQTLIAHVSDGDRSDAKAAVDAAAEVLPAWRGISPRQRSEILHRAYELMIRDTDSLSALISAENGKSLVDASSEVTYAAEFFRWYAEEAVRPGGDYGVSPSGGSRTLVTHKSVGVAALITPWNFPAAMATRKLAPALAAGCTVVLKPASETPLTAFAIARLLQEAGLPDGVVNVVPTTDPSAVVSEWLSDPRVRKISFTGSTRVGQLLLKQAADRIVNASMELGGNAPFVVTEDADIRAAVAGAMIAKFRGGGQACTAANRFYVHASVVDEFTARLVAAVEELVVGPAATGSDIGPLISAKAVNDIEGLVASAVADGAQIANQSRIPSGKGFWFAPTVLANVPADSEILDREIFGPVAPIVTWRREAEMLALVNESEMGLAAYVYSGDLQRALQIAESIDAGMVGINRGLVSDPSAPFGGMKQSGLGREGARAGLEEFLEVQYFSLAWPEDSRTHVR